MIHQVMYISQILQTHIFTVLTVKGNIDGTTNIKWKYKMGNKVEESTPALYKGRAYIMSSDGYLHAIK